MELLVKMNCLVRTWLRERGLLGFYSEGGVWGWCRCGRRKGCGVVVGVRDGSGMCEDDGYRWFLLC